MSALASHLPAPHPVPDRPYASSVRPTGLREQDLSLRRHVEHCRQAQGRWFTLACAAELLHGLLAPRFVTTIGVVLLGIALSTWWS